LNTGRAIRVASSALVLSIVLAMTVTPTHAALQVGRRPILLVKDAQTQAAVPGASVYLNGVSVGLTDSRGSVTIAKTLGQYQLVVSKDGYTNYQTTVDVQPGRTLIAYLAPAAQPIVIFRDDFEITALDTGWPPPYWEKNGPTPSTMTIDDAFSYRGSHSLKIVSKPTPWEKVEAGARELSKPPNLVAGLEFWFYIDPVPSGGVWGSITTALVYFDGLGNRHEASNEIIKHDLPGDTYHVTYLNGDRGLVWDTVGTVTLTPGWHYYKFVADLKTGKYISVTVDSATFDLNGLHTLTNARNEPEEFWAMASVEGGPGNTQPITLHVDDFVVTNEEI